MEQAEAISSSQTPGLISLKGHLRGISALATVADRSAVFSGSEDGSVRLWDVRESQGKARAALLLPPTPAGMPQVEGVAVLDLERALLVASGDSVWFVDPRVTSGSVVGALSVAAVGVWKSPIAITSLGLSRGSVPTGWVTDEEGHISGFGLSSCVSESREGVVKLNGKRCGESKSHSGIGVDVVGLPSWDSGARAVSVGWDLKAGLWTVGAEEGSGPVKRIGSVDTGGVDPVTGQMKGQFCNPPNPAAVATDSSGSVVAVANGDGTFSFWKMEPGSFGAHLGRWEGHDCLVGGLDVIGAATPDQPIILASGGDDSTVRTWVFRDWAPAPKGKKKKGKKPAGSAPGEFAETGRVTMASAVNVVSSYGGSGLVAGMSGKDGLIALVPDITRMSYGAAQRK